VKQLPSTRQGLALTRPGVIAFRPRCFRLVGKPFGAIVQYFTEARFWIVPKVADITGRFSAYSQEVLQDSLEIVRHTAVRLVPEPRSHRLIQT